MWGWDEYLYSTSLITFSTLLCLLGLICLDHMNRFFCPLDSGLVSPMKTTGRILEGDQVWVFDLQAVFLSGHSHELCHLTEGCTPWQVPLSVQWPSPGSDHFYLLLMA